MIEKEVPLSGGRTTAVTVRIGETVRKPKTGNFEFVSRVLRHCATVKFDRVPILHGTDERDRLILSFIEGNVPSELGWHSDETLQAAAQLIRRFHDSTAELTGFEKKQFVACHNDLSPCNCVFREGVPYAIIDFDAVAPGQRVFDIGYAVWLWLDLGNTDMTAEEQNRRVDVFHSAYGSDFFDRFSLVAAIKKRQSILRKNADEAGQYAMSEWAAMCSQWSDEHI